MDKRIGLKDLREHLPQYENRIKKGETFVIYRRSEPLFKIVPVEDAQWEEVIDFTKIKKGGIDIDDLLSRL